ncbi:MAG: anthranilate synthase component I [Chloroflexota bacterium]|nr:anthranilate synthase component I [Chloroflexota bacterium]
MYIPDKDTFERLADAGCLVPVLRELPADLETPISVFLKLRKNPPCFLLESIERGESIGRYSFIGFDPYLVVKTSGNEGFICRNGSEQRVTLADSSEGPDPLHLIQQLLIRPPVARIPGLPRFFGGAVGYISYDVVHFFEGLDACTRDNLALPDSVFLFTDTLVIFDHLQHCMKIVCNVLPGAMTYNEAIDRIDSLVEVLGHGLSSKLQLNHLVSPKTTPELTSNFSQTQFMDMVKAGKEYIYAGDILQVVPSQRLYRQTWANPFDIYRSLRRLNPSPYMFYLNFGDFQLIGSSPETLVKLEDGKAETRPIAGTRPRGKDDEEDSALCESLLSDPKELAEHVMLVDLGRNDIGRVCNYGSVTLPLYMGIERYSHVMHIVSSVKGDLRGGYDAFSLLRACFPAGTVTGAPKIRAMDIITELEGIKRGPYAGAVGYFGFSGNMDTCITIRTIVMIGDTVYLQGGAGVVADSDPLLEYHETLNKVKAAEAAIRMAENRIA